VFVVFVVFLFGFLNFSVKKSEIKSLRIYIRR